MNNPFNLYEIKGKEKELNKATREINQAIASKKWSNVEKVQKKYEKLGADDTDSRDQIIEKWKKRYGKSPRGWN